MSKHLQIEELVFRRSKYKHLSDDEWRWFLQQVEGRQRTADKLPTFAAIEDWWYPVRLSCEQCSSEITARYKAQIISGQQVEGACLDLTGGFGVDTFFLSSLFTRTDYVEQNDELCRIAGHNFTIQKDKIEDLRGRIEVHHCTAEEFLQQSSGAGQYALIFLDPARRDINGGKVFRLHDCSPDVTALLPALCGHLAPGGQILLKLSPMLDITQALKELSAPTPEHTSFLCRAVHIVAVKNEVKEVLVLGCPAVFPSDGDARTVITAIDLAEPEKAFSFTREEEQAAAYTRYEEETDGDLYLFEPNAAVLKSGAYKLVSARFGLCKLDTNTHLYLSHTPVPDFPGRTWRIVPARTLVQANVICRNYPLTPEQLKKKLHLRDGGAAFVIGCRVNGKPVIFHAEKL